MSGRCGDKPTATSFLELFRLFSLYYPTKHILRGSNCDDKEEQQVLLTSYTSWMKQQFKCNKQKLIEKKKYFNDILLKGITREIQLQNDSSPEEPTMLDDSANGKKLDVLDCDVIFYICGYMVHSYRNKGKRNNSSFCKDCLVTVDISPEDLPPKFTASKLTNIKKRGRKIFSSYNLFKLICVVEESFLSLAEKNRVFLRDAFEAVLVAVAE
ncbi:Uncharacterized protein APZ42_006992, partial [Daphnia magna]